MSNKQLDLGFTEKESNDLMQQADLNRDEIRRASSRVIVQRGAWLRVPRRSKILAGTMFPINCSLIMVPGDNVWRAS